MVGVVLPVVLVVLTVLTGLVVTQIRRAALDERLAGNTRESVQLDSAVQTVLRWC
jgi:Tfp pilus assembly protein PilX